ncbi:MAG TPA: hypothetical protein VF487_03990 [Chitinophagaceae bacterium]
MHKSLIAICLSGVLLFSSCKKDEFGYLSQNHPAVAVTVSNLFGMYNGVPAVQTSLSGGGTITIKLDIPASSGRTIKEITRVGIHTTPNAGYGTVRVTTGLYNTAPIPGSGTSVTFTTSITEFTAKTGIAVTTSGTATSFISRYFYFLITLDNNEQVIPVPVRVYVNS